MPIGVSPEHLEVRASSHLTDVASKTASVHTVRSLRRQMNKLNSYCGASSV